MQKMYTKFLNAELASAISKLEHYEHLKLSVQLRNVSLFTTMTRVADM